MSKHIILFLAADPRGTADVGPGREARTIQDALERSGQRDRFELITRWAVQPLDLLHELRKREPTVVHISGQGASSGQQPDSGTRRDIAAEFGRLDGVAGSDPLDGLSLPGPNGHPQIVTPAALQETFGAAGASVKLVVLNVYYSDIYAEALLVHIDCVVAMGGSLRDHAATAFADGFYGGLGERQSVAAAYMQGCAAISLMESSDRQRPRLAVRVGIDAREVVLADTRAVDRRMPIPAQIARDHVDREIYSRCRRSSMVAFNRRHFRRTTFSAPRVVRTPDADRAAAPVVDPSRSIPDAVPSTRPFAARERTKQSRKVTTEPRRWWRYAGAGVAAAAAVALFVPLLSRPPALTLSVETQPSRRFRSDDPNVGDVAHMAVSGGRGSRAIWVYREGVQLVLRCPGDPSCQISDAETAVDLTLTAVGTYHVVAVSGDLLPTPTGDQGVDTAAVRDAGLDVQQMRLTIEGYQPRSTHYPQSIDPY